MAYELTLSPILNDNELPHLSDDFYISVCTDAFKTNKLSPLESTTSEKTLVPKKDNSNEPVHFEDNLYI